MARFRIIAGPNGSGKSTLAQRIANEVNIGYLLNADTIQQEMRQAPLLDFSAYGLTIRQSEWSLFCNKHSMQTLATCLIGIRLTHRAYIFDNSETMNLIAEVSPEKKLSIKTERVPEWLEEHVLKRL